MSDANQYVLAVKMTLKDKAAPVSEDATFGLFNQTAADSAFGWLSAPITDTDYADYERGTVLLGIGDISESADFRYGGNRPQKSEIEIRLDNTRKLYQKVKNIGQEFSGLKVEVREISGTAADPDAQDDRLLFCGTVKRIGWNESELRLTVEAPNRDALMLTENPDGGDDGCSSHFPATFGAYEDVRYPATIKLSKYEISNIEHTIGTKKTDQFLITSIVTGTKTIVVSIGTVTSAQENLLALATVADTAMVHITDGTGSGQWNKIDSAQVASTYITITYEHVWATDPDTTSWLEISLIDWRYRLDSWPCFAISENPKLFTTKRLTNYFGDIVVVNIDEAALIITPGFSSGIEWSLRRSYSEGEYNEVEGIIFYPTDPTHFIPVATGVGGRLYMPNAFWPQGTPPTFEMYYCGGYGLFMSATDAYSSTFSEETPGAGQDNITDRDFTTSGSIGSCKVTNTAITRSAGDRLFITEVFKVKLPEWIDNIELKSIHLFLDCSFTTDGHNIHNNAGEHGYFVARLARFSQYVTSENIAASFPLVIEANPVGKTYNYQIKNLPDWYYYSAPSPSQIDKFYTQQTVPGSGVSEITGKETIKSSTYITKAKYNTCDSIIFGAVRQMNWDGTPSAPRYASIGATFQECAIGLKTNATLEDVLAINIKGRIFDDTWSARKTAANLMESPIDILEHACRVSNWSDVGSDIPALGWGKAYDAGALIKTSGAGSFDDARLADSGLTAITAARQIFDTTEGMSEAIKASLCKEFFLCNFIDNAGYEAVTFLPKIDTDTTSGLPVISLVSCLSVGDIIEPDVSDIWNEFTFEYKYQEWSEKYVGKITISHPEAATYSSGYVTGVTSDANAQDLWSQAHVLYNNYHVVNKMPDDYGKLKWLWKEADVIWHIKQRLAWIGQNRVPITLAYDTARDWYIGKRFVLTLPHQTDSISVTCLIEEITKNYSDGTVAITAIALDPLPARDEWQDTLDALNTNYTDTLDSANANYEDTI